MIPALFSALDLLLSFQNLLAIFAGVAFGVFMGAVPGLTGTMGIALVIPLTYAFEPITAFALLLGAYKGALFSGCIPAILINTPGTPAAAATVLDGYPLSQKGQGGEAMGMALWSSVIGDLVSTVALIFGAIWTPLLTPILVVWCVKPLSAILKYLKYSAVLENGFPASQLRLEVNRGVHFIGAVRHQVWPAGVCDSGFVLIPLMALGVPGDVITAVLLGAFLIHGLAPGPQLFVEDLDLVYAIFIALMVATLMLPLVGLVAIRLFSRIVLIPRYVLYPIIAILCLLGVFGFNSSPTDLWIMLGFGGLGYIMRKLAFPLAPMMIGFILEPLGEQSMRQALTISSGDWAVFVSTPISIFFLVLTVLSIGLITRRTLKEKTPA